MRSGFTLIELLVVLGVLATVSSGVVAMIDPIDKLRQANDAKVINDVAQVATDAAVSAEEATVSAARAEAEATDEAVPDAEATGVEDAVEERAENAARKLLLADSKHIPARRAADVLRLRSGQRLDHKPIQVRSAREAVDDKTACKNPKQFPPGSATNEPNARKTASTDPSDNQSRSPCSSNGTAEGSCPTNRQEHNDHATRLHKCECSNRTGYPQGKCKAVLHNGRSKHRTRS